ncbi:MAG: TetR/AcrR family transcriptional regulator [Pseudomonadota bacterium]
MKAVNLFYADQYKNMNEMTKRGRGRPRSFNPETALAKAAAVFQQKGFDAASLDDLAAATNLTRPSLYAAFGNKEALYLASLQAVARAMEAELGRIGKTAPSLEEALRQFYAAALDRYIDGPAGACGCIVMTTGVAASRDLPAVRAYVAVVLARLDEAVGDLYQHHYHGEKRMRWSKELLAVSTLQTLSIRARAGTPREALDRLVEKVLPALV